MHLRIINDGYGGHNVFIYNGKDKQALHHFNSEFAAKKYAMQVAECMNVAVIEGAEGFSKVIRKV